MAYISRNSYIPDKSVIVDTPKVIGGFFLFLIFTAIFLWALTIAFEDGFNLKEIIFHPLIIIPGLISFMALIRMVINAKGFIIIVPENKLIFPGGGIDANTWSDYLKPSFIFQYFERKDIPLNEIRYIQEFINTTHYTDSKGRRKSRKHNMLEISGNFGAVTFEFYSKGKMDQLYSAIINLNKMGIPVSNR